jgi:hypothetical protein
MKLTFLASPSTAAATARQKSTSRPDHFLRGVDEGEALRAPTDAELQLTALLDRLDRRLGGRRQRRTDDATQHRHGQHGKSQHAIFPIPPATPHPVRSPDNNSEIRQSPKNSSVIRMHYGIRHHQSEGEQIAANSGGLILCALASFGGQVLRRATQDGAYLHVTFILPEGPRRWPAIKRRHPSALERL